MPTIRKIIQNFLNTQGYDIVKKPYMGKPYPSRVEGKYNYVETPIGTYCLPANGSKEGMSYIMSRGKIHDKEVVDTALKYIQKGTAVLDLGANFGQMSLLFSEAAGSNGKVYSFEAQKDVYEMLCKTVELNNRKNIEVVYGAVYNESGRELIFPEPDPEVRNSYSSTPLAVGKKAGEVKGTSVKTLTIDSLNIQEKISFMKVDIQGADLYAMMGAKETILRNKMPIIFEFEVEFQEEFGTCFQDYVAFTASIDYVFADIINNNNYLIVPRNSTT